MPPMRFRASLLPYSVGVCAALALCMPLLSSGCGTTACLQLDAQTAAKGVCPSSQAALKRFSDPNCPGISSVDSEGSLDGSLCCYSVSKQSSQFGSDPFGGGCVSPGVGGGGGFTSTGGVGGTAGFSATGGAGGACGTCVELTQGVNIDISQLCPAGASALMDLTGCVCSPNTACDPSCIDSLCQGLAFDQSCLSCLFGDNTCMAQFQECEAN
jgi:hypothetical protein